MPLAVTRGNEVPFGLGKRPIGLREGGMDRLVHRICVAQGHQQLALFNSAAPWAPNSLTFVEGKWAYCPAGEPGAHEWRETEPRTYAEVRDEVDARVRTKA